METTSLTIEFTGLCLFATARERVSVLLPNTTTACGEDPMPHVAEIWHPRIDDPSIPDHWHKVSLEKTHLDLTSLGSSRFDPHVPPSIANLYPFTREKILRATVEDGSPANVQARVALGQGEAFEVLPLAEWEFHDLGDCGYHSRVPLSHIVQWVISGVPKANSLILPRVGLHGQAFESGIEIRPLSNGSFFVKVKHTPSDEEPHCKPVLCEEAAHFRCYYGLFANPNLKPVPRFRQQIRRGDLLTCMSAQAPVGS